MKKYRFVLLPLVTVLVIILITVLFALPKTKTTIELKGELKQDKEKLSRLTEKATLLQGLDANELETKVKAVERALPSKKAVAEILAALSSASNEAGVFFVGFEISPGEMASEKFEEVLFKAMFEGPRDKVRDLLGKINQVLPVMKVISFEIKKEKTALKIEGYFSPLPKTLGKIDAPLPEISRQEGEVYEKIAQLESFEKSLPSIPTGKENPFSGF